MKTVTAKARFTERAAEFLGKHGGWTVMRAIRAARKQANANDAHESMFEVLGGAEFLYFAAPNAEPVKLCVSAMTSDETKITLFLEPEVMP